MSVRFVIVGGGPGGNTAATVGARLGAEVTLIERDLVGGAAHLLDCIPSKAMIATGGFLSELERARGMGLAAEGHIDLQAMRERVTSVEDRPPPSLSHPLPSHGGPVISRTGRLKSPPPGI